MTCLGLVAGYFICYGTTNLAESLSWRLPFAILTALSFSYVLMTLFLLPASPRWLIIHGRESEAEKTWDLLGVKHEDRRSLENEIQNDGAVNNDGPTTANELPQRLAGRERHASFLDLFSHDVRKRTILAVFMMGFLQLCGIDAVLYVSVINISERAPTAVLANAKQYAPLLFQQAGLQSAEASFLASGISGIVIVATSVPALLLADKWGRRTSTIFGGLGLTITMLLIGGLYAGSAVDASSGAARWVVIVCIYL
jgi:Sugar (and other) transporter